jgi:hypothetical protein
MATENVLATQVTIGMLASGFLQFLKTREWLPFINKNSAGINHAILLATSAAGALGVNFAWNASAHSLTITGLSAGSIAVGLWIWAKQWSVQFLVHRGVFGPVAVNGVAPHPIVPAAPSAPPAPDTALKP